VPKNLIGQKVTIKVDFRLPPLEFNSQSAEFTLQPPRGRKGR